MPFLSKGTGGEGNFDPVPQGAHIARCVSVVDLGIQQTPWGSKEKVYIGFEIPSIRVEWKDKDGKEHEGPALIGSTYTNSIHEKSVLGQHLVNWRGRAFTEEERNGFDLFTIVGVPCMVSVTHKQKGEKIYANVSGIMGAPAGTVIPDPETPQVAYSPQAPDRAADWDKMPEWLQIKCRNGHQMDQNQQYYQPGQPGAAPPGPVPPVAPVPGHELPPPQAPPAHGGDFDDDIPF